jgi:hypothetical protein
LSTRLYGHETKGLIARRDECEFGSAKDKRREGSEFGTIKDSSGEHFCDSSELQRGKLAVKVYKTNHN